MKHYWPRIYRFLDQPLNPPARPRGWPDGGIEYRFRTHTGMDLEVGGWGRTFLREPGVVPGVVDIGFHPALTDKAPSLLIGTLAHEGLHAIMLAIDRTALGIARDDSFLRPEQAARLISHHPISQVPPGYGERLVELHGQHLGETGIELLTNKLLQNHGHELLERRAVGGGYTCA